MSPFLLEGLQERLDVSPQFGQILGRSRRFAALYLTKLWLDLPGLEFAQSVSRSERIGLELFGCLRRGCRLDSWLLPFKLQ